LWRCRKRSHALRAKPSKKKYECGRGTGLTPK
jgi:hypothetical protein